MRATGKRIVVKMNEPLEKTSSGLYIPESAMSTLRNLAEIVSVGEQCTANIKDGEFILVRGARSIPNLPYDVVEEADVICVVSDKDIEDIKNGVFAVETQAKVD